MNFNGDQMKLDYINKKRNFSKRALSDFSKGLIELLREKKLEEIRIGELCEKCSYPRSTFYNYFEDVYVLMDYCWENVSTEVMEDDFLEIKHEERTLILFERVYAYMDSKRPQIEQMLKHNPEDGVMVQSLNHFLRKLIYQMIMDCPVSYKYPVPYEIIAEHYSNTVQLMLEACFIKGKQITKEDAIQYMDFLLGTLEKESTRK